MTLLMAGLLFLVGLLLRETNFSFYHVTIVLVLFASSRVFASLALWITNSQIILSYLFVLLCALSYLRWLKRNSTHLCASTIVFAILAIFTREEAYTVPVVLPLLWWVSSRGKENYRRALLMALAVASIVVIHYILRTLLVPGAPQPRLSLSGVWVSAMSAWMPGGYTVTGFADRLLNLLWIVFVTSVVVIFIRISNELRLKQFAAFCLIGAIFCAPALAVARPFGVALPAIAFITAISIATVEVYTKARFPSYLRQFGRPTLLATLCAGLMLGVVAGLQRSRHVADALNENSIEMVLRDGEFLFDMYGGSATIPEVRRAAKLARLNSFGILSADDVSRFRAREKPFDKIMPPLFVPKYRYYNSF